MKKGGESISNKENKSTCKSKYDTTSTLIIKTKRPELSPVYLAAKAFLYGKVFGTSRKTQHVMEYSE